MSDPSKTGNPLLEFPAAVWDLMARMAPYLLFGFAVAGLLHALISAERVRRALGRPGLGTVIKGSLVGVPMPLCSCSVIPVAASLRRNGASRGATASFLSSTPQTGVDSILATYALMGGVFTVVRVAVAFVCGIATGVLIDRFAPHDPKARKTADTAEAAAGDTAGDCCRGEGNAAGAEPSREDEGERRSAREAVRYGFVTLPADLATALGIGLLLAGLITVLLPTSLLQGAWSSGAPAFLLATAISFPLYVCATASIPMAFALVAAGLSPGAALVFLIAGPATNTATVAVVWNMLGRGATAIYVGALLVVSWLSGWLLNIAVDPNILQAGAGRQGQDGMALWQHAAGAALVAVLAASVWLTRRNQGGGAAPADAEDGCCHS